MPYKIMDLFSGVGGLSYGFSQLNGYEIVLANEIQKDISIAYKLNHPNVKMLNCDIKELTKEKLEKELENNKIDIILGGPPCQSYSTIGKREMDDRANLFMEYKRILSILEPKVFIFENVKGILSMDKGKLFKRIQNEFNSLGYQLKYKLLNAADYGVPQTRERVIIVGIKNENNFEFPEAFSPHISLCDALSDLPSIKSGESATVYKTNPLNSYQEYVRNGATVLTEHKASKHSKELQLIMDSLKDGEDKFSLPENIRPKKGFGNTYAKLWWNKPSVTITRNFACPSSSRCIHPKDSRALTIREGARLQSFPDTYIFYGSDSIKRLEIGNAVPPLLSKALAIQLLNYLNNK